MPLTSVNEITSAELAELINDYSTTQTEYYDKYDRYMGEVAILSREKTDTTKINNQIAHDFRGNIVDSINGYMFGEPIAYEINPEYYEGSEKDFDDLQNEFRYFRIRSNVFDVDSQTGKYASICGTCGRLVYVDVDGLVNVAVVKPWECIFVYDTAGELLLSVYNYSVEYDDETIKYAIVYDSTMVAHYILENGFYILNPEIPPKQHLFDYVPLVEFKNNEERLGDFDKVEGLIDAYDRIISDADNEFEEWRLALLAFVNGAQIDSEEMADLKEMGALNVPDGDVKYLIKDLPVEFLRELLDRLEKNIYRFAHVVDMSNENFSGSAVSGIARMYQLLPMENKCSMKERKFVGALQKQFKVICSAWSKLFNCRYEDFVFKFTRNLPVEVKYHAEVLEKLSGLVPLEVAYSLMPFIDDAHNAAEQMKNEQSEIIDLDAEEVVDVED